MSFLNGSAKGQVKNMLTKLEEPNFKYLMADLYAREGANISFETASTNVDFILSDENDFTDSISDVIAAFCLVLNREISYIDIENNLSTDLPEKFGEYYFCTTSSASLDSYTRSELQSQGYTSDWFTLKNYQSVCSLLQSYDDDYLVYLHYEITPADYTDGIRDENYIQDRFDTLGISVAENTIQRVSTSKEPLHDIQMIEKFVLSECVGSGLLRNHIKSVFDTKKYIQVAVQNGRPSYSEIKSNIFKQ